MCDTRSGHLILINVKSTNYETTHMDIFSSFMSFSPLCPNIFLNPVFSDNLYFCCSLKTTYQPKPQCIQKHSDCISLYHTTVR